MAVRIALPLGVSVSSNRIAAFSCRPKPEVRNVAWTHFVVVSIVVVVFVIFLIVAILLLFFIVIVFPNAVVLSFILVVFIFVDQIRVC